LVFEQPMMRHQFPGWYVKSLNLESEKRLGVAPH